MGRGGWGSSAGANLELVVRESEGHGPVFIKISTLYGHVCGCVCVHVYVCGMCMCVHALVRVEELALEFTLSEHQAVSCGYPQSRRKGLSCCFCLFFFFFPFAQAIVTYVTKYKHGNLPG